MTPASTWSSRAWDVVVVGAGIAGLAAALRAVELGASVLVLEKTPDIGGSTRMSGGWFAYSGTDEQSRLGIRDDAETFVEDMQRAGSYRTDDRLLRAYVEHQHSAYAWSKQLGARYDVVKLSSGQSAARSHHTDIRALLNELVRRLSESRNAVVVTGATVRSLISGDGRVSGVAAHRRDVGQVELLARRGVILTTGGFSRSPALLERFAPEQLLAIPYGGLGNTGDGLRMAWEVGAGARDMELVSGTFGSHPETSEDEHELLTAFYMGAIIVNQHGKRFVDESVTYKEIGRACLGQPSGLGFEIFDQRVRDLSQPGVPLSDIGHLEDKGRMTTAATVGQLAHALKMDPTTLQLTVAHYNAAVREDCEDELGRTALCNGVGRLTEICTPPFYAYPAKTLMTSTFAGLTVASDARVLAAGGGEVPGLMAAGEVTGGFHGTSYVTGTALTKGLIFGRVAAETAVSSQ